MTTVRNTLKEPGGAPIVGQHVSVSLVTAGWVSGSSYEVLTSSIATTDASGVWTVDLAANTLIDPAGTYYVARQPGGDTVTFTVPATGGPYWVHDILVVNPASPDAAIAAVRYTTQALTEAQQKQALANIGAVRRLGNPTIAIGDSITIAGASADGTTRDMFSWFSWATLLSDAQITLLRNAGVGGDTSGGVLARLDADVIAYSPSHCIVAIGANDANAYSVPVATYAANIRAIVNKLIAARIVPVLLTVTQRSDTGSYLIEQYNTWLVKFGRDNGVTVVDAAAAVMNPATGFTLPAYTSDGLHPSKAGAQVIGQAVADALATVMPRWSPPIAKHQAVHGLNLVPNGLMLNNAGGLATGWGNTGAGTPSIVAAPVGNWQRLTAGALGDSINTGSSVGYAVGDRLAFTGKLQFNAPGWVRLILVLFNSGQTLSVVDYATGVMGSHTFYGEITVAANSNAIALPYVQLGAAGDWAQVSQLAVINLSTLPD